MGLESIRLQLYSTTALYSHSTWVTCWQLIVALTCFTLSLSYVPCHRRMSFVKPHRQAVQDSVWLIVMAKVQSECAFPRYSVEDRVGCGYNNPLLYSRCPICIQCHRHCFTSLRFAKIILIYVQKQG